MDARINIKGRLPGRLATEAMVAPSGAPADAALHLTAPGVDVGEIFKKTPCAAGLQPAGRDVAKDMYEFGAIPLLMKTLLANGYLDGNCMTVTGRTIAENLKSVNGNLAPGGAIVRIAGVLQRGDIIGFDREAATPNVNLSDVGPAGHPTKWQARATNHKSGARWKYAQEIGPAADGAVTYPGGAHEKQCYADI